MYYKKLFLYSISAIFMTQGVEAASADAEAPRVAERTAIISSDIVEQTEQAYYPSPKEHNDSGKHVTTDRQTKIVADRALTAQIELELRLHLKQFVIYMEERIDTMALTLAYTIDTMDRTSISRGGDSIKNLDEMLLKPAETPVDCSGSVLDTLLTYLQCCVRGATQDKLDTDRMKRLSERIGEINLGNLLDKEGRIPYFLEILIQHVITAQPFKSSWTNTRRDALEKAFFDSATATYRSKQLGSCQKLLADVLASLSPEKCQIALGWIPEKYSEQVGALRQQIQALRPAQIVPTQVPAVSAALAGASIEELRAALAAAEAAAAATGGSGGATSSAVSTFASNPGAV
jgi:hypothetical protein